ncbi:Mitogen-activated protein kinase kinase 5 [Phytophthora pseudosyringae]|uniref:mitogen-activated protein kinase kinase n=1 Tax=Phytophthora pseudosyringae TaxID=221518 RepID=A0A8T1VML0_9STRA|nr:Mitogen-activated protein kinase kinase 5 [Phytophthora pseudosyringae]
MMKATEEWEAKPQLQVDPKAKAEAKASSMPSRFATPTDERRAASRPADAEDKASPLARADSGVKESKLKQPEVKILDRHRPANSSSPSMPGEDSGHADAQAESKTDHAGDSSLHAARSVQSLANDMRRIRSMRTEPDEAAAGEGGRKPKAAEKKKSGEERLARLRPAQIKLEIADLELNVACPPAQGAPGRQATRSPKLSGPSGFGSSARPGTSTSPTASSAGKRGIQRNFVQGLGSDFQLDLHAGSSDGLERSYDLSASGTFDAVGFQIKQTGLTRSPDRDLDGPSSTASGRRPQPSNTKKHLVKLGVLGRGASGVVHKALHVPSLMLVAVKVIPVFEHEKRHQLIAELKSLYNNLSALPDAEVAESARQTVACPELVCLYDAFMNPNEGNVSIVVEYMDGGSLQDIVDTGGCTSEVVLANISLRVLKGLAFLHSTHQLHRDIKPSNLLINHFGDVKVSDFGIVREMENSMAKATTFVGTLTYMSPERIASEEYSYKSDVWSFGLSIMTCALGKFPYSSRGGYWELLHMIRNEPPPRLPEGEFSGLFCDFLDKCLKKDQTERWSVKQLLNHEFIQRYCGDQAATPSPGTRRTAEDPDDDAKRNGEDGSKEQAEVDEIVQKVAEHYFKDAKELIKEHGYTLDDIVAWLQLLPAMQKVKLSRFAEQIGVSRSLVCVKFQEVMNDLLHDIEETYFGDAKQQSK